MCIVYNMEDIRYHIDKTSERVILATNQISIVMNKSKVIMFNKNGERLEYKIPSKFRKIAKYTRYEEMTNDEVVTMLLDIVAYLNEHI
ncbi:MAG: hypothetical protein QW156_04045 [Candidatus Aenigmatarchaeota archaeon]